MAGHKSQMGEHYSPSTPFDQISTALPSAAADDTDDTDESDSELCTSSNSPDVKEHSDVKQDSRQSYYSTDTSLQNGVDDRTIESPKKLKKQVSLTTTESADEIDVTTTVQGHSLSDEMAAMPTNLPGYILNFERPRSSCDSLSWNALPLAINSSFLSKRMQIILRASCNL